mmetsp:Transcript_77712/g.251490  ORF Transcript_77712/g.251490 Transcript_77712/m.251490 type:complete len:398 (+) Transcript_77712:1073-2266(+)
MRRFRHHSPWRPRWRSERPLGRRWRLRCRKYRLPKYRVAARHHLGSSRHRPPGGCQGIRRSLRAGWRLWQRRWCLGPWPKGQQLVLQHGAQLPRDIELLAQALVVGMAGSELPPEHLVLLRQGGCALLRFAGRLHPGRDELVVPSGIILLAPGPAACLRQRGGDFWGGFWCLIRRWPWALRRTRPSGSVLARPGWDSRAGCRSRLRHGGGHDNGGARLGHVGCVRHFASGVAPRSLPSSWHFGDGLIADLSRWLERHAPACPTARRHRGRPHDRHDSRSHLPCRVFRLDKTRPAGAPVGTGPLALVLDSRDSRLPEPEEDANNGHVVARQYPVPTKLLLQHSGGFLGYGRQVPEALCNLYRLCLEPWVLERVKLHLAVQLHGTAVVAHAVHTLHQLA